MHYHTYHWIGQVSKMRDRYRRPTPPPHDPGIFLYSKVPPLVLGDWLLRPIDQIKATYTEPEDVLAWLEKHYLDMPSLLHPDRVGLEERLQAAEQDIRQGKDVDWSFWLKGQGWVTMAAIACPNKIVRHPCPLGN